MLLTAPLLSDRLLLRTMTDVDANENYLSWMQDSEINRYLEIRFSIPSDVTDIADFIERNNVSADSLLLGIFLREDGRHIGNIKIGPIVKQHARSEIGYLIGDRSARGKGYATEAIREICRYGFEDLRLDKITAGVYETNKGSIKALLNVGFVHEATIPLHVVCEGRRIASLMYGLDKPTA